VLIQSRNASITNEFTFENAETPVES
jgi:hypothetical protein